MDRKNIALDKAEEFALKVVQSYKWLCDEKHEYVLSKQFLRSGTSIGANLSESVYAISKKDFQSKVYIALKETNETLYWIRLLYRSAYLAQDAYDSLLEACEEIRRILMATTKTLSTNE